jgi:hypothetical protein
MLYRKNPKKTKVMESVKKFKRLSLRMVEEAYFWHKEKSEREALNERFKNRLVVT